MINDVGLCFCGTIRTTKCQKTKHKILGEYVTSAKSAETLIIPSISLREDNYAVFGVKLYIQINKTKRHGDYAQSVGDVTETSSRFSDTINVF